MISGISALLLADSRPNLSARISPVELVEGLKRVTATLVDAVEKHGGIVHLHVGGSLVAYWPPEKMPSAARDAVAAATAAIAACGDSLAVSVAVADFAIADVGRDSAKRPLLVGPAYQRAEASLRLAGAGRVAVDAHTLEALPADISVRFVKDGDRAFLR